MLLLIDPRDPLLCRSSPCQEYHTATPHACYRVNDLLCEALPALIRVAVGLMCSHGKAGVEEQDAAVGPRREEPAILGWRVKAGVLFFEELVDIFEGRGSWCR